MKQLGKYNFQITRNLIFINEIIFFLLVGLLFLYLIPSVDTLNVQRKNWVWLLTASSLLSFVFLISMRRKVRAMERFSHAENIKSMSPEISTGRHILHFLLWRWAIALLLLAIINPRFGKKEVEVKYSGIDLIICLDVSNSMLAEDISPNRLIQSKRAISQLLKKLHGDRVGLIVFAGDAYVQLPMTTDYSAAEMFISSINTDMVQSQGTAIGKAIDLAVESFSETEDEGSKAIIVITDGENHEDDAVTAAKNATEQDVVVHTIGMGAPEGAPLPIVIRGRKQGYKKDNEGNTVISKLDPQMLQEISTAGNGVFIQATNADIGLGAILDEIEAMTDTEFGTEKYADFEDRFQILLLIAAFLILIEMLLPYRRSKWLGRMDIFE